MSDVAEVVVVGEAPDDVAATPAQVTVIPVDERLPASADVATAVARAPGVVVRRLGGLGGLAQVGIRGAGARQSEVLLDGIPLNPEGGSAVDLSELPLRALDRIEVYRGQAPALLGATALGGAVALWTADEPATRVGLSGGSWATARADATVGGPAWLASVEGFATAGGFRWFDDGGTPWRTGDERVVRRENDDAEQVSALVRWRGGPVTLLWSGLARDQGVPGFTSDPSAAARYALERHLVGVRGDAPVGGTRLSGRAFGLVREESLADPLGEIGVGGGTSSDRTLSAGLDGALRAPLASRVRLDLGAGARADAFAEHLRRVVRGTVALPISEGLVEGVPAVIVMAVDDRVYALPRAGVRVGRAVALKANAGGFARPPDVVELYGDRGALVGNPGLVPEHGLQVDLGLGGSRGDASAEVVAFHAAYRDLVAWTQNAQGVARPENVDRAAVTGVEAAGGTRWRALEAQGSGTLMSAVDRSEDPAYAGNQLPRVPIAEASVLAAVDPGPVRVAADLSFAAGTFADRANFVLQPPRTLLGATLSVRDRTRRYRAELDVRNVLDTIAVSVPRDRLVDDGVEVLQAMVDFTGYPLPGRTLLLSVVFEP